MDKHCIACLNRSMEGLYYIHEAMQGIGHGIGAEGARTFELGWRKRRQLS